MVVVVVEVVDVVVEVVDVEDVVDVVDVAADSDEHAEITNATPRPMATTVERRRSVVIPPT